jgi:hypothetical protein
LLLLIVLNTSGQDAGAVLTAQPIAQEIIRSVVATVGLVAAVPLTTALAAFVCSSRAAVPAAGIPRPARAPAGAAARHRRFDAGEALAPGESGPEATW